MKKIIAFGASSSKASINKQLATYVANEFADVAVEILDLNAYEMPIFSVDKQQENRIPKLAQDFYEKLGSADLIVISFAEHNGAYSSAFKNILDWTSRISANTFQGKPMFLLATSPGPRGGSTVLEIAKNRFPFQGGIVLNSFSLPNFNTNFDAEKGILNGALKNELNEIIQTLVF